VTRQGRQLTLGRAWDLLDSLTEALGEACPMLEALSPAGDARRFEPLVSSLALVGRSSDPTAMLDLACAHGAVSAVLDRSARRAVLVYHDTQIELRIAAPDEYGTALFMATGAPSHVEAVARRRGRPTLCATEADVYAHAGLPWIAPELRQGADEIDAALSRTLPDLVSREHIRGDLHMHSNWSDGQDSIAEMVAAAAALGYEYIALTDHSENAAASCTVRADQLAHQRDEIDRLRARFPTLTILHGIEVDILENGRLDFPDHVLEPLDIVLASLHEQLRHDGRTLTRRCIAAIQHPLVNVITHPANRLVGRRDGYDLDFEEIYAAARETGTALEIDGAPGHLDLDGEHARAAVTAGATVTIDSDCHRARALDRQMRLGIGTARRGWVEPGHVLNTRPLDDIRAFIRAKRSRG
jgi:DNA polymerase (family 10)